MYKSECKKCNPPGCRIVADREEMEANRVEPSLYVGDIARSVSKRANEPWDDTEKRKE